MFFKSCFLFLVLFLLLQIDSFEDWFYTHTHVKYGGAQGFPDGSDCKESACNAGDLGSIPGSRRSSGEGNGNPLQYSCLENPMDRGAWQVTVQRVLIGTGIWNLTTLLYQALILNYVNVNKLVKAMVFPVVMYGCESWTIKKAEHRRIDGFELWC